MVTVFAGGPPKVDPLPDWDAASGVFEPGADVVGVRRAEDAKASSMLRSTCRHLNYWDAQYRNATYGYKRPIDEVDIARALKADLETLVVESTVDTWIVPMGLLHRDHVITAAACLSVATMHPEIDWLIYEDLPYAISYPEHIAQAIDALRSKGFKLQAIPVEKPYSVRSKRELVDCYQTQLRPLGHGVNVAIDTQERIRRLSPSTSYIRRRGEGGVLVTNTFTDYASACSTFVPAGFYHCGRRDAITQGARK